MKDSLKSDNENYNQQSSLRVMNIDANLNSCVSTDDRLMFSFPLNNDIISNFQNDLNPLYESSFSKDDISYIVREERRKNVTDFCVNSKDIIPSNQMIGSNNGKSKGRKKKKDEAKIFKIKRHIQKQRKAISFSKTKARKVKENKICFTECSSTNLQIPIFKQESSKDSH